MGDFIGTTISGMTGRGSIRHNNRSFSAANIDRSRTEQNVTYCNDDLKQVYHEIFDEALAVKAKLFCPEIAGLFCRIAGLFCHDSRANLSLKPVCFGIAIS